MLPLLFGITYVKLNVDEGIELLLLAGVKITMFPSPNAYLSGLPLPHILVQLLSK